MISAGSGIAFFGISVLLALAPGPDNVFVLLQSALYGRKTGVLIVLGLCTGLLVHTAGVALGLAALFAASGTAYTALKLAGAAYLAFLAWQAFRAPTGDAAHGPSGASGAARMYARGIAMNVTNPKVAVFFLAFLPQFVDANDGRVALQVVWLGLLFIAATLLTFGAIAYFSADLGKALRQSPRLQLALNRIAGLVLLGLAARLALE